MTIRTKSLRLGLLAVLAATLTACSTTPTAPVEKPKLQDFLGKADQAVAAGNKEQAVTLWKQGAAAFPADKTPWSHIAETRFESQQYGEAIQAAQEVLVRDPNDTKANSIVAISGLRLSTQALASLRRQNNLTGSTKTDAQELAKVLRENLGERDLVPPPAVQPPRPPQHVAQPQQPAGRGKKGGKAAGAAAEKPAGTPFDILQAQ